MKITRYELHRKKHNSSEYEVCEIATHKPSNGDMWTSCVLKYPDIYKIVVITTQDYIVRK